jgi:hypothetical protein
MAQMGLVQIYSLLGQGPTYFVRKDDELNRKSTV